MIEKRPCMNRFIDCEETNALQCTKCGWFEPVNHERLSRVRRHDFSKKKDGRLYLKLRNGL